MKGHWQILSSYQATVNYATDDLQIQLPFVSRKDDWGGILYWHQEQSTIIRMSKTNLRTKVNKKWHHASQCYLVFDLKIKGSMLGKCFRSARINHYIFRFSFDKYSPKYNLYKCDLLIFRISIRQYLSRNKRLSSLGHRMMSRR